jgi:hypothetical protein
MSDAAPPRAHSEWFDELRRKVTPKPPPAPPRAETEPPAEHIQQWLAGIDQDDPIQTELAARAARLGWEIQQGDAALKALLAQAAARADRERLDEVERLGQELLRGPAGPPSIVLRRLESTPEGCRWLIDRWLEFVTGLDLGKTWVPADLLRLVRLLGKHPAEAGYDESLNAVMSTFEARYCGMAELVFQQSQADVPPELRQPWRAWAAEPPEGSGLRECLLGLVGGQLRRLRERVEALESEPSSLAASEALADRRVMAMQRLQLSRSRELRLALDLLRKARAARHTAHASPARPPCVPPLKGAKEIDEPPAIEPQPRPGRPRPRRLRGVQSRTSRATFATVSGRGRSWGTANDRASAGPEHRGAPGVIPPEARSAGEWARGSERAGSPAPTPAAIAAGPAEFQEARSCPEPTRTGTCCSDCSPCRTG